MISFSAQITAPTLFDALRGSDITQSDKKRLGAGYLRVFNLMKDGQYRTPEQIAEGSNTRIDSSLRYIRYCKQQGHKVESESKGGGLHLYRVIVSQQNL